MSATRRRLRFSLAEALRSRILAGEWEPGERLPSEPELARLQLVSRSSMRAIAAKPSSDAMPSSASTMSVSDGEAPSGQPSPLLPPCSVSKYAASASLTSRSTSPAISSVATRRVR